MEKMQILTADLLDIVFDGRNKNYGAYELRKSYSGRMEWALTGTAIVCLLFIVGNLLAGKGPKHGSFDKVQTITLSEFKEEEKKQETVLQKKQEQQVATEKNNVPLIVIDDKVKPEDEIKDIDELENVKIGNKHIEGIKDEGITDAPSEPAISTVKLGNDEPDYTKEFKVVQIQARFPDGMAGWNKFLQKNLNSDLPVQNGAPAGTYTVIVSFVVDKTGSISEVQAENDPGFGTKEEAIHAIKKSPNWIPAEQNGRSVIYRQKQAISFRVAEE